MAQADGIRQDERKLIFQQEPQIEPLVFGQGAHLGDDLFGNVPPNVDMILDQWQALGIDAREVQHVVHETAKMLGVAVDSVGIGIIGAGEVLTIALWGKRHGATKAQYQVQRPADSMTDRGGKARLGYSGLLGPMVGQDQLVVHPLDAIGGFFHGAQRAVQQELPVTQSIVELHGPTRALCGPGQSCAQVTPRQHDESGT